MYKDRTHLFFLLHSICDHPLHVIFKVLSIGSTRAITLLFSETATWNRRGNSAYCQQKVYTNSQKIKISSLFFTQHSDVVKPQPQE